MVNTFGNNIIKAYTGGVQVKYIYSNGVQVWPVSGPTPPGPTPTPANNEIFYTSTDGNIVTPHSSGTYVFGANLVSNTYSGYGVMTFDDDVTMIGNQAFKDCTGLTSIMIPSSVTNIGMTAFAGCTGLTSITIPSSVTNIGNRAFDGCTGLTSITIPSSVTFLGDYVFLNCSGLTSISVDVNNTRYDSRDDCNAIIYTQYDRVLKGCRNTVIPSSVTSIATYSFNGCTGLTSITIPSSVTDIGSSVFSGCTDLSEVIVNCTVPPTLGSGSFDNTSPNLQIKVPAASLNAYLTAPGWSDYASRIVGYSNTDEIDFTTLGLEDRQVVDVDTYGPFSSGDMEVQFTTANPAYMSKYYNSDMAVRMYRENSVVISSSKTISQIEFTWTGSDSYRPSSDVATPSGYDYQTYIWTGSASQVTLTRSTEAGHWKLKSVLVTYQ